MEQIHEGLAKVSDAIVEYVNGVAVLKVLAVLPKDLDVSPIVQKSFSMILNGSSVHR